MNEPEVKPKNQIIQNKIYVIYWPPGAWKTIFATYLASFHKIIWANFDIKYRGKPASNRIANIQQLSNIPFSAEKQVIVLDEGWVNNNARRSSSDANLEFGKLAMLGRKKNANIIQISQLERMTDVYYRELAEVSFSMTSWYVSSDKLMFEFEVTKHWVPQGSKFVDLFKWKDEFWYEYDTLESWIIDIHIEKGSEMEMHLMSNIQW